jgi:Nup53/35/40-type RNA recognition motif
VLENVETPSYEDSWVTVFGFSTDSIVISAVLQDFQSCGNIQMWIGPPVAGCNWVYIQFESPHGAQRALQRNGTRLGLLNIMVGVQHPSYQDKQYIASQSKQAFRSEGMHPALPERNYALAPTREKVCAHVAHWAWAVV